MVGTSGSILDARGRRHAQGIQLAGQHIRAGRTDLVEHQNDLSAHQIRQRLRITIACFREWLMAQAAESTAAKDIRKLVIADLSEQITKRDHTTAQACLRLALSKTRVPTDIHAHRPYVTVRLADLVSAVWPRAEMADKANKKIVQNPDILTGEPVFKGTRVPIDAVLESLEGGDTLADLQNDWRFLDAALVDSAKVYRILHPRRGRPRRLVDSIPHARLVSHTVIAPRSKRQ
jgi:uncharacterized protein (DUF433 family)